MQHRSRLADLLLALAASALPACEIPEAGNAVDLAEEPVSEAAQAPVAELRAQAAALAPLVQSPLAHEFLDATAGLPAVPARALWRNADKSRYWTDTGAAALGAAERSALELVELGPEFYYTTRYGTPLAYARPLDIVAAAGLSDVAGRRVFDFGYGGIGHLRLLASLGADVVGVEVDPLLAALYSEPGDQGLIRGAGGAYGRLALLDGSFPSDAPLRAAAGGNFDLVISKNTLKNGYIHPAQPVDPKRLVHLGASDEQFVAALADLLAPGGLLLIYNLCPAPAPPGQPYIPWADGRCPFPQPMLEAAGLTVLAFDQNDDGPARAMGHALGWDEGEGAMDLQKDLFGVFTLARKAPATVPASGTSPVPAGG